MNAADISACSVCRSVAGVSRISPGPFIYEGTYWMVDHAYPAAYPGWLVIVLKRHAEALHELSFDEFRELADLQYGAVQALSHIFSSSKEYVMAFGEGDGFAHLHVHVVPRSADLPAECRGANIFKCLDPSPDERLGSAQITSISEQLAQGMRVIVASRSGPTDT